MNKTSKSTQKLLIISFILFVIVGIAVLVFGWYYIMGLSKQVNMTLSEAKNIEHESELLSNLSLSYSHVSDQKDLVLESMPDSKNISSFLATVENLATQNGVEIESNKIGETATKAKSISDSQLYQTTNAKGGYYELRIDYVVVGNYIDITGFIKDITSLRRVVSVEGLSFYTNIADVAPGVDSVTAEIATIIYIKK
jgi:Tfp pilus assembly protein PilO